MLKRLKMERIPSKKELVKHQSRNLKLKKIK